MLPAQPYVHQEARVKIVVKRPADLASLRTDLLAIPLAGRSAALPEAARSLDERLSGTLSRAVATGMATAKSGASFLAPAPEGVAARAVALLGLGDEGREDWEAAGRALGRRAGEARAARAAVLVPDGTGAALIRALAEGVGAGAYRFSKFRTRDEDAPPELRELGLAGRGLDRAAAERAERTVAAVRSARDLVNAPANHLTPSRLAERAQELADAVPDLECSVFDEHALQRLGAGALLAVAQGSEQEPRMIVLRHRPRGARRQRELLGLVGKAMTFDSGGISIKPSAHMEEMKMDMGGGAAVIEGAGLIAAMGLPVPFLAVVPSAENMPSGRALKPGDVITAMNGTTIEVINTDAEGRLILADALTYSVQQGATRLLDLATLTGAIVVALGGVYAGLFGSDPEWTELVRSAAEASGDLAWPLPLHPGYDELIRSRVADLANASNKREAGPVYAAQFLREFTAGTPWCHVDIAGTAMREGAGTGFGVRLIAEIASRLAAGAGGSS
jgi:leucyl aminopeptidase